MRKNLPDGLDKLLGIDFVILDGICELSDFVCVVVLEMVFVLDERCDETSCFDFVVFKVELDE